MYAHILAIPLVHRRRRAFFLARFTQQVQSSSIIPELLRAGAALAAIVAWGGVLALIVG
ncbi:MAG TPA: hypothetical protein VGQ77_04160 [Methylomirabilota bacterium]|nr:hypothetical protein [Methylomirabilota bacterium]